MGMNNISRTFRFTAKKIRKLPANPRDSKSTDQEYSDSDVPGLKLFVSKTGRKSYHFRFCIHKRKRVLKIADFECIPLPEVRLIARKYRGMVSQNIDPLTERDKVKNIPDFKTFAATYMEWCRDHKRSWKDDDNKLKKDLIPIFGNEQLADITSRKVQEYLLKIKKRTSGASSNRHRSLLSKMFSLAISWGVITCDNPISKIAKYSESAGRLRYLNAVEIQRFIKVLDEYQGSVTALLLKFLLFTGLRLGETKSLKWDDVCDPGKIHIRSAIAKSKKNRFVELNSLSQSVLLDLESIRKPDNQFIFWGRKPGTHLMNPNKLFKTVKLRANVSDICIHTLRHTFASLSISAGTNLVVVQAQLGHSNYKTTEKYCHIDSTTIKAATEGVAQQINRAVNI